MKVLVCNISVVPVFETEQLNNPIIIDGVEAYKTLCPISKESGLRENPLHMLESLANDPSKKRILDSVLQEIPSVRSVGDSLSDAEKFDMLIHRAEVGTKAEVSTFIENSRPYIESLLSTKPKEDTMIKFDEKTDDNSVES